MKLGDIQKPLLKLLYDAGEAETFLEANDSQFARRSYVRTLFVYVEGAIWLLKQVCLKGKSPGGVRRIKPAEYAILSDESYDLKNNGETVVQTKFLRLPENVRFCIKVFNRLFESEIDLGVGTTKWEGFLIALKIRHRITHPRNVSEFDISDNEIELCKGVLLWFNDMIHGCFQAMLEVSKRYDKNPE
jgi:hypothetical protein